MKENDVYFIKEIKDYVSKAIDMYNSRIKILKNGAFAETREFTASLYEVYVLHLNRMLDKINSFLNNSESNIKLEDFYQDISKRLERLNNVLELDKRNVSAAAKIIPVKNHKQQLANCNNLIKNLENILNNKNISKFIGKNKKIWGTKQDIDFLDYSFLRLLIHKRATLEDHNKLFASRKEMSDKKFKSTKLSMNAKRYKKYPHEAFLNTFKLKCTYKTVKEIGLDAIEKTKLLNPSFGNDLQVRKNRR